MLLLILHGVLLAYSVIGRLAIVIAGNFAARSGSSFDTHVSLSTTIFGMGAVAYVTIYVIFIIGIILATIFYLAARMQKSLFSDEGYLTNTLPVTPDKLLWSKILIFWTWSAIDFLCVALSIFILFSYPETMPDIIDGFQMFFTSLFGFDGFHAMVETITVVLALIIEYFFYITALILFSICLGSLFKTHKALGAVVSFFGINIGQSIVMLIVLFIVPPLSPISTVVTTERRGYFQYGRKRNCTDDIHACLVSGFIGSILFWKPAHSDKKTESGLTFLSTVQPPSNLRLEFLKIDF